MFIFKGLKNLKSKEIILTSQKWSDSDTLKRSEVRIVKTEKTPYLEWKNIQLQFLFMSKMPENASHDRISF